MTQWLEGESMVSEPVPGRPGEPGAGRFAEPSGRGRPTIRDIARSAGVSPTAVSFALNGRPGVAEPTRQRILATADALGWSPNAAARALSESRASSVGLVIARPEDAYSAERFHFGFLVGVQTALQANDLALVLQLAPDIETESRIHRQWWAQRRVDGVIVLDPRADDPRPELIRSLGIPAVLAGGRADGLAGVHTDDEAAMALVVDHLIERGYHRIAYVGGPPELSHVQRRAGALATSLRGRVIEAISAGGAEPTEAAGRIETERLLAADEPPDAVVYDNEVLALGGLAALTAAGRRVGSEVGIVSLEDSPLCRMAVPPVTALQRDPSRLGSLCADLLAAALRGASVDEPTAPLPDLMPRASTAGP